MKLTIIFVFFSISLVQNTLGTSFNSDWYKYTDIYEIDVGAFKDSDGDGFGDLQGMALKLDHIEKMGFGGIKLSPIYSSTDLPMPGYPIDDFRNIHLTAGTIRDFDVLMKEAKSKNIKVILDFIINECSTSHEWFIKSRQRIDPYTDYFIWRNHTEEERKSDTISSHFWNMDDTRKQLYYTQKSETADLNLRNELVKEEVKELIKFWFDKGVAGLNLIEPELYIEDPLIMELMYPNKTLREFKPESYEFIHELREFVDKYSKQKGDYQRILMTKRVSEKNYGNLRGSETHPMVHIVSSNIFEEIFPKRSSSFFDIFEIFEISGKILYNSNDNLNLIQNIMKEMENGPSLFISENSENKKRLVGKFKDPQLLNTWIMSLSMCKGVFHMFYGQEIGLDNFRSRNYDFLLNFPFGSSMHWDDSINAGFTSSEFSMVPPNVNYWQSNVEKYTNEKFSTLQMTKDLLKLRRTDAIMKGDLKTYNISESVFAFSRSYEDKESYLIIFNFANVVHTVELNTILEHLPSQVQVAAATPNASYQKGENIVTKLPLQLRPASGMVLDVMKEKK